MNKRIVGIAAFVTLVVLFFVGKHFYTEKQNKKQQAQAKHDKQLAERAARQAAEQANRQATQKAAVTLHQVCQYADEIGIDTSRYSIGSTLDKTEIDGKLMGILLEVRYGKKPSRLAFSGLKGNIDSAWARQTETITDHKALAALSSFAPYNQLIGYYSQLRKQSPVNASLADSLRQIRQTLNFYRYINRFGADQFLMVNIPAGELNVFDKHGERLLPMQVIAGKPDRRTPCMTTYIQNIVMYPQWNVPDKIALEEMLPRMKRNIAYIYNQNLQILDKKNREVDPEKINWEAISETNFPYRVRQASGCENSLGLLKFNLANPLAIYLHDTNSRNLFTVTTDRWRSHGCVRVQEPVKLANLVLGEEVFDDQYMETCLVNQKPHTLPVPKQFPVFITYNVADVDSAGKLRFYKDVYALEAR